uniref:Uncharacterized protein n=1 Tax=Anguilla anguilla TaxID=7936 RepID=A0A0E9VSE7_ANGAN
MNSGRLYMKYTGTRSLAMDSTM